MLEIYGSDSLNKVDKGKKIVPPNIKITSGNMNMKE
jgi:hypothetical protein